MIENFQSRFDMFSQNMTSQISQDDDDSNAYGRPPRTPRAQVDYAPQIEELWSDNPREEENQTDPNFNLDWDR